MDIKDFIRSTRFITYQIGGVVLIKDTECDKDYSIDDGIVDLLNDLDADYKLMRIDRDKFHMLFKQWLRKYMYRMIEDLEERKKEETK